MRIYKDWDFDEQFVDKTPLLTWATRKWMMEFIITLGEDLYNYLGESVDWEAPLHIVPGVEQSGYIPLTNGGLKLILMASLEADADSSHYPSFPCVRDKLAELDKDMEQDYQRKYGAPLNDAGIEQYHEFVDDWNADCDAYVDYVLEVWQEMDKVHFQAYVSLDDDGTVTKNVWYVNELPDPYEAASDLRPIIMAAWERKI